MDKKDLRQLYRQKRKDFSLVYGKQASLIICEKLKPYLQDKRILSYYPFTHEVDVSFINDTYPVAYPLISDNHQMDAYQPINGNFIRNRYGINEPDVNNSLLIPKNEIDVIIVPLLSFNEELYRLGYGGGYYDRYLCNYQGLKIGVAYEIQKTDQLIPDLSDIRMDIIITEEKIYS